MINLILIYNKNLKVFSNLLKNLLNINIDINFQTKKTNNLILFLIKKQVKINIRYYFIMKMNNLDNLKNRYQNIYKMNRCIKI